MTLLYCVKTAKDIVEILSPLNSPIVFWQLVICFNSQVGIPLWSLFVRYQIILPGSEAEICEQLVHGRYTSLHPESQGDIHTTGAEVATLLPHCECWGTNPYKIMLPQLTRCLLFLLIFSVVIRHYFYATTWNIITYNFVFEYAKPLICC